MITKEETPLIQPKLYLIFPNDNRQKYFEETLKNKKYWSFVSDAFYSVLKFICIN